MIDWTRALPLVHCTQLMSDGHRYYVLDYGGTGTIARIGPDGRSQILDPNWSQAETGADYWIEVGPCGRSGYGERIA